MNILDPFVHLNKKSWNNFNTYSKFFCSVKRCFENAKCHNFHQKVSSNIANAFIINGIYCMRVFPFPPILYTILLILSLSIDSENSGTVVTLRALVYLGYWLIFLRMIAKRTCTTQYHWENFGRLSRNWRKLS